MKSPLFITLSIVTLSASSGLAATVFTENFDYDDGPLVTAAGSPWVTHSGATPNQVDVASNAVNVTFSESEDVSAPIAAPGNFYNDGVLTLTMTATFTALPGATAGYFTHFKDGGTSNLRGRVFATTAGAAAGSFRLGISNSTSTVAFIETDFTLNSPLSLSMTWNVTAGTAALSVNGGAAVAAIDAANPTDISTVALRQAANIGTITIDNVLVDATVAAVPEPSVTFLGFLGLLGILRRRR